MAKSRPMGYIFPKRIQDAIQGEEHPFGSKYYSANILDEETKKKLEDEKKETQGRHDALQELRDLFRPPSHCPACSKKLTHQQDTMDSKMWRKRGVCFDCVVRVETHLKATGRYTEYETQISLRNYKAWMLDIKQQAEEFLTNLKDEVKVVNHDGSFDTLRGDQEKVREFMRNEIKDLESKLDEVKDIDMSINAYEAIGIDMVQLAKQLYDRDKKIKEEHAESITNQTE